MEKTIISCIIRRILFLHGKRAALIALLGIKTLQTIRCNYIHLCYEMAITTFVINFTAVLMQLMLLEHEYNVSFDYQTTFEFSILSID